jgi:glutamate-1-semialdehyde 2,1-aminomutase
MAPVEGTPLIELLLERLSRARSLDQIVLATGEGAPNDPLVAHVLGMGYEVFRGSENDVLDRFYQAAKSNGADRVVRITGDCPLVDPEIVDAMVARAETSGADYVSNVAPATFPDGLDVEVFSFSTLERSWQMAESPEDREHVCTFMRASGRFLTENVESDLDLSEERWTVDDPDDLEVVRRVFHHFLPRKDFTWHEILELRNDHPGWFAVNQSTNRNEGADQGTGQKLWKRAKRVIPGGNMLLSKRPEMFLPNQWPSYFSKASGCQVWDLDGNQYTDMSYMSVGTNTLGYGREEVDQAVLDVVAQGNMSTLNCPEEVYLAERLVDLHPWADMARFTRTGGEANSVAIRIARAASGRDQVAICGYHGWHDWYLAANLGDDDTLSGHLLPGLEPKGVPTALRGTVHAFKYNRFDELLAIVDSHDIGVIKMEVIRSQEPSDDFLKRVRRLATERGIVLVFDECTSGFRQSFGGIHMVYGVEPDIAVFGKALGNGYAMAGVIGRREVMEAAQTTFISSSFWTERIGPAAALKTLEVMEDVKSWEQITRTGAEIKQGWEMLATKHGLSITTTGLPALAGFSFDSPNAQAYKTLITQEMLAKGYLAGTNVYASTAHTRDVLERFFTELDPVFGLVKECEDGRDVETLLRGPIAHNGFTRLN